MRKVVVGSFLGFVMGAAFLAACGGSGPSVTGLQSQIDDLRAQLDAHEADLPIHQESTPWLALHWCIALEGVYPSMNLEVPGEPGAALTASPMLGGLGLFAGNFPPRGWAFCEGQVLPINQYDALYSLIGTTFGGNGTTSFGLPDLRGRTPIHPDASMGISWGEQGP